VTKRTTVTTGDLRRLCALGDPHRLREAGHPWPPSVLEDLLTLVPGDAVTYQAHDPYARVITEWQGVGPWADAELGGDAAAIDAWFWAHYWTWPCSYPDRTGDHLRIFRRSDARMERTADLSHKEFRRMLGARHEVMVSLASTGGISHRFLLWRHDGPDFSDHDVLLLRLIRPHLVQLRDAMLQQRSGRPALTARQNEVLQMVAAGLTNGQIARRLQISSATVGKHLENIYAALDVTNRTAAAARIGAGQLLR
jgi:DNA-binding CsgD family transcriptional regulator